MDYGIRPAVWVKVSVPSGCVERISSLYCELPKKEGHDFEFVLSLLLPSPSHPHIQMFVFKREGALIYFKFIFTYFRE